MDFLDNLQKKVYGREQDISDPNTLKIKKKTKDSFSDRRMQVMNEGIVKILIFEIKVASQRKKTWLKKSNYCHKPFSFIHYLAKVSKKIVYKFQAGYSSRLGERRDESLRGHSRVTGLRYKKIVWTSTGYSLILKVKEYSTSKVT